MEENALIIFIKTPVPGYVKTRFQPDVPKAEAVLLYSAFLNDLQKRFENQNEFICWYAVAPEEYDPQILTQIIQSNNIFLQSGNDLGQRMSNAIEYIFKKRFKNVVLIGSDIPHLPVQIVLHSFKLLKQKEYHLILGPAEDGGYYLIGMYQLLKDLFTDISWSTGKVFNQTFEKAKNGNYIVHTLKQFSDVDDYLSLRALHNHLRHLDPESGDFPANTWMVLDNIIRTKN